MEQIRERVIVVAAAQLAVSSLPGHGKRAAASPARTRPSLDAARSRAEKEAAVVIHYFWDVKVVFHKHVFNTCAATMIITIIRA